MTSAITTTNLSSIRAALAEARYETARRLCLDALQREQSSPSYELFSLLHEAYRHLRDFQQGLALPAQWTPVNQDERFRLALMMAEDFHALGSL